MNSVRRIAIAPTAFFGFAILYLSLAWPLAAHALQSSAPDIRLLFFTSPHCPPCRQMEPVIDEFIKQGYPVSKIDTQQPSEWVQQFQVNRTPTAILLVGGEIFRRQEGLIQADGLVQWFREAKTATTVATPEGKSQPAQPPFADHRISGESETTDSTMHRGTRTARTQAEQQALRSTVRLKVEDDAGFSYATGVVIHSNGRQALVVTCGHVFRDSRGQGTITAEWDWESSNPHELKASLISYDSEQADVALVAVMTEGHVPVAVLGQPTETLTKEQAIFTLGCDHGQPPTIRHSRLKNMARYNNSQKLEIYGRPVLGRSGGGLFTTEGKLIGICNAAAVDFDEGIYTALENIYQILDRNQLAGLFESPHPINPEQPGNSIAMTNLEPVTAGATGKLAAIDNQFIESVPLSNSVPSRGQQAAGLLAVDRTTTPQRSLGPDINTVGWERGNAPATINSADDAFRSVDNRDWEAIVILRHREQPALTRTLVIDQPSSEFMEYLGQVRPAATPSSADPRVADARMANLRQSMPQVSPSRSVNSAWTRAQSPD